MIENHFVVSKGIMGIRTNLDSLKWSFGTITPATSQEEYENCMLRLRLNVDATENLSKRKFTNQNNNRGKYHYFEGEPSGDALYYRRQFLLNSQLQIEVRGLLSEEPCINCNKTYYHYITHRFMNLHSIGYILTDLAVLLLLKKGYAPLHCSAFRKGDATVIVFAPPNTGKTLTTMMACMGNGADFIAEDIAITDGTMIYSVPWTSTFRYYSSVDNSLLSRIMNKVTHLIPPLELFSLSKPKPITQFVAEKKIANNSKITHVVVLERGVESIISDNVDNIAWKIANLNRYEFYYMKSPLITAYEFFNPSLDVNGAYNTELRILRNVVNNAKQRLLVRTTNATHYAPLILDAIH